MISAANHWGTDKRTNVLGFTQCPPGEQLMSSFFTYLEGKWNCSLCRKTHIGGRKALGWKGSFHSHQNPSSRTTGSGNLSQSSFWEDTVFKYELQALVSNSLSCHFGCHLGFQQWQISAHQQRWEENVLSKESCQGLFLSQRNENGKGEHLCVPELLMAMFEASLWPSVIALKRLELVSSTTGLWSKYVYPEAQFPH